MYTYIYIRIYIYMFFFIIYVYTYQVRDSGGEETKNIEDGGSSKVGLQSIVQVNQQEKKTEKEHRVYSVAEYLRKLGVPWPGLSGPCLFFLYAHLRAGERERRARARQGACERESARAHARTQCVCAVSFVFVCYMHVRESFVVVTCM
jgi:hypothetical protein